MKSAIFEVNLYWSLYTKMELRLLIRSFSLVNSFSLWKYDSTCQKAQHTWLAIKSDGSCHRTSDTLDPQIGRKSEGILRKSVMWEAILAQAGALKNLYRACRISAVIPCMHYTLPFVGKFDIIKV